MAKLPFNHNPHLAARFARLHRLKRKRITPATDKASLRQSAADAAASTDITIIPMGKRSRSPPRD